MGSLRCRTWIIALTTTIAASLLAGACTRDTKPAAAQPPCAGEQGVGTAVPAGLGPGDLVEAEELDGRDDSGEPSVGFPTGARVWRVLYVSTGADETQLELVCGLVAAPEGGPREFSPTTGDDRRPRARMLAWSHGTIGLDQRCLPSSDPAQFFWGKMPGGINAIAWGSLLGKHEGDPSGGALQYALDQGWVVTASDYQPTDTYVMGKIAGANVLDAARAGSQLLDRVFGGSNTGEPDGADAATAPDRYDLLTWGHSQGGHAAIWAGQLAEPYLAGTTPSMPTAELSLAGVVALAPATNFLAQPDRQPGVEFGDGLADSEMHQSIEQVPLPIGSLELQIGPALFSYIFGSWSEYSAGETTSADAAFPAYPPGVADLDLDTVATAEGRETIETVQPLCFAGPEAAKVLPATAPYRDAAEHAMLTSDMWNLPESYEKGEYFKGGVDRTCADTDDPAMLDWCRWILWNTPGPLGDNPFPKVPSVDGTPVPMFIGQGTNDQIIHCRVPDGGDPDQFPDAADCMSHAYFDAMSSEAYCPDSGDVAHLHLEGARKEGLSSPGSHFAIPGEMSAAEISRDSSELVFEGSPVQQFMDSAFDGDLDPGCSVAIRNASRADPAASEVPVASADGPGRTASDRSPRHCPAGALMFFGRPGLDGRAERQRSVRRCG